MLTRESLAMFRILGEAAWAVKTIVKSRWK